METNNTQGFVATAEQIAEWKKKYKNVFLIEVEGRNAYLKSPDRNTLSYASTVSKNDPMKFNEVILKNCWLAGDEEIKDDDRLFLGAAGKLDEIISIAEAQVKKL